MKISGSLHLQPYREMAMVIKMLVDSILILNKCNSH